MTASFGITALNELQELYNGKSIAEDGAFALEVMQHINDMVMKYEVHKEHGSSRWYVTEVGCKEPIPGTYGTKKRALHTAAKMNGLDYKDYMRIRRRDGMNHD